MSVRELSFKGSLAPIHIFKIEIDEYYRQSEKLILGTISISEQQKAKRFLHVNDSRRFLATRFAVRNILSGFINIPPEKINFHQTANKKPAVSGLEFNLAHSGNLIVIIVSSMAVGIDLEWIDPIFDYNHLIDELLTLDEKRQMLQSENPLLDFYATWTRKEAVLKATGEGLIDEMNKLDVMQDRILRLKKAYHIRTFSPFEHHYVCSVASIAELRNVAFWNY